MAKATKKGPAAGWFEVDKDGLAKLVAGRPRVFILHELLQNAWDENTTQVVVTTVYKGRGGSGYLDLCVEDDNPEGFANLAHAWTLFAESAKKGDVKKRGRFNMGEKLMLALCDHAEIVTTTGCVRFSSKGRKAVDKTTDTGSRVEARIPMTKAEYKQMCEDVTLLLPPHHITTIFNGVALAVRGAVHSFTEQLATEYAGDDGVLRPTWRKAEVQMHRPLVDETPHIFEMGIPVVELEGGDRWHLDIQQKVPLNMNRDNVTPSFRRALRTHVLNHAHALLTTEEEAGQPWVREAADDKRCTDEAIARVLDLRYGKRRVAYDPNDKEANAIAVAKGYRVVHGGGLSGGEWKNAKRAGAIQAAGAVTPSPKILSDRDGKDDAYPEAKVTDDMRRIMAYAEAIGEALLGVPVRARLANRFGENHDAWYAKGGWLTFNVASMGKKWFKAACNSEQVNRLLIHEFAHEMEGNHLSHDFHDACCKLGARLAALALERPDLWETKPCDYLGPRHYVHWVDHVESD